MSERASDSMAARSRRAFLSQASGGLGALALATVQAQHGHAARDPLAPRDPHHAPKAKSVIWCFMEGGPSHMDTFDPKPALEKYAGQPMPESYGRPLTAMPGTAHNTLMPSKRKWAQHGESGLWVSDWYPHVAEHVDDLAVIRSCTADGLNHVRFGLPDEHRLHPGRAPLDGGVGDVRAGIGQSQPANLRHSQ